MAEIKVTILNKQKKEAITPQFRALIRRSCAAALKQQNFEGKAEVTASLVDNETIRQINCEFRNIDSATDVLSFPLGVDGVFDINYSTGAKQLGDIVLSVERARSQAEEYGHSFEREAGYLTVHSMLHLLGYDHVGSEEEAAVMRENEEQIMEILGLPR